jgi:hypothetical protein
MGDKANEEYIESIRAAFGDMTPEDIERMGMGMGMRRAVVTDADLRSVATAAGAEEEEEEEERQPLDTSTPAEIRWAKMRADRQVVRDAVRGMPVPDAECPICYKPLTHDDYRKFECGHAFCRECKNKSLELKNSCPMCRGVVNPKRVSRRPPPVAAAAAAAAAADATRSRSRSRSSRSRSRSSSPKRRRGGKGGHRTKRKHIKRKVRKSRTRKH